MKLASFELNGMAGYGIIEGDEIVRLDTLAGAPSGLKQWLAMAVRPATHAAKRVRIADVTLLPPIPNPAKILCVATNFHEPARDSKPSPDHPLLFTRFADSLVGHGQPLVSPPESQRFDFEGEVAVIIGAPGRRIARDAAMEHVAGYACFNDGSARDWQKHSSQFTPGKNFYRSGAFGPWLTTSDAVPDLAALKLETRVNGVVKQEIGLDRFIFDVPWLIAYISAFTPLSPGDVIATGTPSGFGSTRQPPEFLGDGDVVEVEVSGLGTLRNRVTVEKFS